ncbi:MAG: hypothetical protein DSY76_01880 [Bacteroidetes bacterium]|nr:MAG: hypothetical protein DSY76_01880 [Bacteroidota bacterium]
MKKAAFIFVILGILLQSCIHYHASYRSSKLEVTDPNVFPENFQKALYKTNIHLLNKDYSGIMFFKRMVDEQSVRMVFMSEFGLKYFDFELLDNGQFAVKYILDELNKESIVNVLEQDMKLLFPNKKQLSTSKLFYRKKTKTFMAKYRVEKGRYYYFFDEQTAAVSRIEYSGAVFKKIIIRLSDYSDKIAKTIDISHVNIALKLKLSKI